jgi:hypothetical protein
MAKFDKEKVAEAREKWLETKKELEFLMEYPPFFVQEEDDDGYSMSLADDSFNKIKEDFFSELKKVDSQIPKMEKFDESQIDPEIFSNPFSDIEDKYSDELEEARLWMARYPTEPDKAVRQKLKG